MKKLIIIGLAIFLGSCQQTDDLMAKRTLLEEKQKSLSELQIEIANLKKEISEIDTSSIRREGTPVRATSLQPQPFAHFLELTGTVSSRDNILISAEAGGRVLEIPVKEGDEVQKGQILVKIDNESRASQLQEAQAVYELAKITYEKRKNLWDQSIGSEISYLQARNSYETARSRLAQIRKNYENSFITSPIKGRVDRIAINEGELVGLGTPVVRVVDLRNIEVEAELSEEYLPNVRQGDSVRVSIPAIGYMEKAAVSFVSQVINPDNRSFMIKVALDNEKGILKPNLLANLLIQDYGQDSALVVPTNSIGKDLKGDYVFTVVKEDNSFRARKKYVTRGRSFRDRTQITDGLQAGERIITAGSDEVHENSLLKVL